MMGLDYLEASYFRMKKYNFWVSGAGGLALLRDVATETPIFISLPRGVILQDEIIQFLSGYWGRGSFAALLRDVATETLIFLSLPRGLILQDEIIQFCG